MLEQPTLPYWKHFFLGVPAPGGAWMVLSPAVLVSALDAKGSFPALREALQNPYFGIFMLLFVGSLMASRLPTISLKSVHISKSYMLPVMAGLLLLIAFLVSNFWLTIGVVGILYICTVPVTGFIFLKSKARYEQQAAPSEAP
jgi:CDP-diacylglycerol--serine O-phosphatidyltransferase